MVDGKVEWHQTRLVTEGFAQTERVDSLEYLHPQNETESNLISTWACCNRTWANECQDGVLGWTLKDLLKKWWSHVQGKEILVWAKASSPIIAEDFWYVHDKSRMSKKQEWSLRVDMIIWWPYFSFTSHRCDNRWTKDMLEWKI